MLRRVLRAPVYDVARETPLEEAEQLMIQRALDRHQGNVTKAAEALGLSRSALYRRLPRDDDGE